MEEYGLGRIYTPDPRDRLFPMTAAIPAELIPRTYRYWWAEGWWGDQGLTSQCVAYAWLHFLEDGPITHAPKGKDTGAMFDPQWVYCEAQKLDEWEGDCEHNSYDGTSVRAGAKVLQAAGIVGAYYWAWNLDPIIEALLYKGPVVVGTFWYDSMFYPDGGHYITPKGPLAGGHAYLLNGVNTQTETFRIKNSWGHSWGKNGHAYIRFEHMAELIDQQGEACIATELKTDENL